MMYPKLLKIYIKNTFSKNTFGNTKTKKILFSLLMVYAVFVIGGTLTFMFYALGEALNSVGQIETMITFLGIYALIVPMFMTLFRASGTLFYYKDFSIVGPLPIKSSTVFLAKLTVIMLWLYVGSLAFILPIGVTYFYFAGFDVVTFFMMVAGLLVLPMLPILIMSLISLFIGFVSSKTRVGVVFQTIMTLGFLLAVMFLQFGLNGNDANPLGHQVNFMMLIQKFYMPLQWFYKSIVHHDVLNLIFLVLSNVLVFVGGVYIFEKISLKINKTTVKRKIHRNKTVVIQSNPIIRTLVKKEMNKFFSIPLYMINVGFGLVLMLLGAFLSVFFKADITEYLSLIEMDFIIILGAAIGFMVVLTYSPAVSLSLEGKNLWILKSLPISPKVIIYSKVLFNLLLVLPVSIFSILLFGYALDMNLLHICLLIFYIVSLTLLSSHLNGIYNLFFPKFDFENEAMVIKQSMSALLATFGGMALIATNGILFYLLSGYMSIEWNVCLIVVINIILTAIVATILYKVADKQFRKFE